MYFPPPISVQHLLGFANFVDLGRQASAVACNLGGKAIPFLQASPTGYAALNHNVLVLLGGLITLN